MMSRLHPIIHPITFRNYIKHPIKVLRNNITSSTCNLLIKRFSALHLNIFVPNVFNKRNLPEIQDKNILCLAFNHVKESVSSKKSAVRLLNKTVSKI